jgi:glutamate racemase
MSNQPIGVFDSGYGGLTILKELVAELPAYDYLYLGDNARAPYGDKSFEEVYAYTLQSVEWFFKQGCSLVILACNTASAKALRSIQQYNLPLIDPNKRVLGVIRPTSEVVGQLTDSKHIGIMGTQGTIQSESYIIEIAKFFPEIKVTQEACPEWVSLVEKNLYASTEADYFVKYHIDEILSKDAKIDTLLLACTHYPILIKKIKQFTPTGISIISQGEIVAKSLSSYLNAHKEMELSCSKMGKNHFFTTGDVADFNAHASLFFGVKVAAEKLIF